MSAAESLLDLPVDTTPIPEAAEMYVRAGLAPIPLYGLTASGECTCPDGKECPPKNRGKHPVGREWQKQATLDADDVRDRFRGHRGNLGVFLGLGGHVLIDADGETGLATAASLNLPATLTQKSGSGIGAHYIYRLAAHQDARLITDRKVAAGLDVKVRGQFVAAPSRHASGKQYRWTDARPVAILPDWLFERIRKPSPASFVRTATTLSPDVDGLYERARKYLDAVPPAIAGSGGHDQAFAAARALAGWLEKGLPEHHCWGLLLEYNLRCQPPWTEKELDHKWEGAKAATTKPAIPDRPKPPLRVVSGGRHSPPTHDSDGVLQEPPDPPNNDPDWQGELLWSAQRNGKQKLIDCSDNVIRILQLHPGWRGRIRYDEFRARVVVTDPPWDEYQRPSRHTGSWTDEDDTRLHAWMRRNFSGYAFNPSIVDCQRSVTVVARTHDFNPVRDYLSSVEWDGTPRLSQWLLTYLGANDSEYMRLVGPWWLISAVARIFEPGCKVDTVPILEGRQGLRKSSALRVLFGADYFNDTPIDIGSKDAYAQIQGVWGVELAELDSLMRVEPTKSKAFFSSGKDRFRRAYARHERDELRQCIFVGTTNGDEYLNDPTGGRRFWPIPCTAIRLDALATDRDQLWAEAVHEYREGRKWYPETAADLPQLEDMQASRTQSDAWESRIRVYLGRLTGDFVTVPELLEFALKLDPKDWGKPAQTRVGGIMSQQFARAWPRDRQTGPDGQRVKGYRRAL